MRVAALETLRIFWPPGDSADPSGPWKPWVVRATEISAPAGRTAQPAGVTRPLRAASALAGSTASASRRKTATRRITTFDAVGRTEATRPLSSRRMATRLRFLPALGTIVGVAVLLRIVYEPWFLNYDARYALVWARDLADGLTPDYTGPFAPTPHPLETAVSLVAVPFGSGGDAIMSWAILLAFGLLVWLAYRLGAELFSVPVGVVTALVVLSRPALERDALLGYQDTAFAVVIVWAVLLEARQSRRGVPVLLLLAVGGLMRPEAWALAGLYTLYLWRGSTNRERAMYAGLTALAPVLWALADWAVTGDALHSLHGTADLAETVDRRRDPLTGPYWAAKYLGYTLREPMVIGIPIGLAFAWHHARARAWLPFAAAVAMLVVFLLSPFFGLPLIGRYVRTPAVLLAVFYGLAVFGWKMLPEGSRERRFWAIAAGVAVLASVAYLPWHGKQLSGLDNRLVFQGSYYRDLRVGGRGARRARRVRRAAGRSPRPTTARSPTCAGGSRATRAPSPRPPEARDARIILLPRRTRQMRRFYRSQFPRVAAPAGFVPIYRNGSWRVLADPACA